MNTYTITFADNETVSIKAFKSEVKDGILRLATNNPSSYDHFFPIANIFEWSVKRG